MPYILFPPSPRKGETLVNRDIKIYPPLLTWIENVSGISPYLIH